MRVRDLAWEGCLNVRDLGGLPTEDGRETRSDAVIRADTVWQLSDTGWATLVGAGVSRIVDLRQDEEREADPPRELAVQVVHIPLFDAIDEDGWERVREVGAGAPTDEKATAAVYLEFLEHCRRGLASAVAAVADAPEGAVVVHCHGGKDRTGLVAALLLRLAGVAIDDIAGDYALSEERLRPRHDEWLAGAADDEERAQIRRLTITPASAMRAALRAIDERYGGVDEYLRGGGVPKEVLDVARDRLRA